ncbi:DUF3306 domain-containing protein [Parasedimentitalea marina]|uniref:DUF3306 domain-containing protein n=1 Tax=Parasedimentitalea marina TaxID=2483033 RepID=A0A3T0MZB7_9RHOB|nr:DUF3306 domain-containing protein [Parasedimentitalea marina]AZV77101.1 DUF3306 domain-containing protein [Parasedimentitalea marina]
MSGGNFWARRKAGVEAELAADAQAELAVLAEQRDAEVADKSDAELLAELELPDPDSLGEGDDFTVFLTETIPARIRTRALRRLWLTNPVLANVDGLVDYGEDFTDASCVIENIQTAYQVGKGMTAHVDEMARQAAEEEAEAVDLTADDAADALDEAPAADAGEEIPTEQPEHIDVLATADAGFVPDQSDVDDMPAYTPPRRMRFAFEDATAKT